MNQSIRNFFSNPWVGVAGSIASIIGIPLAVYLAIGSTRVPHLIYYVHPVRTPIVTAGQTSDLHVTYKATEISGSVSAFQIAIWNSGKQPVRAEEILSPIDIVLDGCCKSLEASIRKRSRDETQFRLDTSNVDKGILGIVWRILEGDDGGIIQIVYNGDTKVGISVNGTIVGQQHIQELKYSGKVSTPAEQYVHVAKANRTFGWCFIVGGVLMPASFAIMILVLYKKHKREVPEDTEWVKRRLKASRLMILVPSLIYILTGIYFLWKSGVPTPPFGF